MSKLIIYFLCTILAIIPIKSLSVSENSGRFMCLLKDPPNQCGEFCLSALMPLIDHIAKHQNEWNNCDNEKRNETQAKLQRIEDQQTETRAQIGRQQESLEKSWKKVVSEDIMYRLNKMELQQTGLQGSQAKIEEQLSAIQETLNSIKNKTEGRVTMISSKFQRIGSRYFYIESVQEQSWTNASDSCQKIGGRLASIHNEEEFNNIVAELNSDISYMLGISDLAEKGVFITKSTGKKAPFLKWKPGEPRYDHPNQHCVTVHDGGMWVDGCSKHKFICEFADD
ncbi:accessory gland protein Acp29AB-like [Drosophila ficusphila]|uniref:accessory gland protein Acp29AB-like n=1 Tax=Drosophila ficusphila TaxID=30025 RepID=UPI0007E79B62|nr:accessory gland protein Acp29AB-like [Drosophila ficusphila]